MSVIFITEHNENIFDVKEKPEKKYIKPPRHISKHNKHIRHEMKTLRKKPTHATMGVAEILPNDPKDFLRKRSGVQKIPTKESPKTNPTVRANPIPKYNKEDFKKKEKKDNFIRKNINYVKKQVTNIPEPKYVDSRFGDKHGLEKSGLQPKYMINKEKFGKPPNYLLNRMRETEFCEKKEKEISDIQNLPKCRYVTRQERDDLLIGLKKNWDQLQKEFQLLPIITDTIPKVLRKVKLEKDLLQLEKDICLIEKHPYIYVDDNTNSETSTIE